MKNVKKLILGLLIAILTTTSVFAFVLSGVIEGSRFYPNRESLEYKEGILGFPYPTFNNFTDNPNISSGERNGEERAFTLAQRCINNNCPGSDFIFSDDYPDMYHNELDDRDLIEGDLIRFEIYFHNNGEDRYDDYDFAGDSADALNVEIGVDLRDMNNYYTPTFLKPKGYIYADNNNYISDISKRHNVTVRSDGTVNSNLVITNANSDPVRITTDDVRILNTDKSLKLIPVEGSAGLYMKTFEDGTNSEENDEYFDGLLDTGASTAITIDTFEGDVPLTATPHYSDNKMWINFTKLPGCFRYSGFAYFDAIAVKEEEPPTCAELKVDHNDPLVAGMSNRLNASALDTNDDTFGGLIEYTIDQGFGEIFVEEPDNYSRNNQNYIFETFFLNNLFKKLSQKPEFKNDPRFASVLLAFDVTDIQSLIDKKVFTYDHLYELIDQTTIVVPQGTSVYVIGEKAGGGVVHVRAIDDETGVCARNFDIADSPICRDILVNHPTVSIEGTYSEFSAKALNIANDNFGAKVTYSVPAEYGYFNLGEPTDVPRNTNDYIVEFDVNDPIQEPAGGFCEGIGSSRVHEKIEIDIKAPVDVLVRPQIIDDGEMIEYQPPARTKSPIINSVVHADTIADRLQSVTVDPGTPVYFVALKEGDNVVFVRTNCTGVIACARKFNIRRAEPTCERFEFTAEEIGNTETPICIDPNAIEYGFNIQFYDQYDEAFSPNETLVSWTSTDPTGLFGDPLGFNTDIPNGIIGSHQANYIGGGEITVALHSYDSVDYTGDVCTVTIPECDEQLICTDIVVNNDGTELTEIAPNTLYKLTADATYSGSLADEMVTFSSTQGLFMSTIDVNGVALDPIVLNVLEMTLNNLEISSNYLNENVPAVLANILFSTISVPDTTEVYFLTFTDASGIEALSVYATDRSESECLKMYDVVVPQPLPCESIAVSYFPQPYDPTNIVAISVKEGQFGDFVGDFRFTSEHGNFLIPGDEVNASNPKDFTQAETDTGIIFTGGQAGDTITIEAIGENAGTTCNYLITGTPATVECIDLEITRPSGRWTSENFTGSSQKFRISVETSPAGLSNNFEYKWEVTSSSNAYFDKSVTNTNTGTLFRNTLLDLDADEATSVTVYAIGQDARCEDSIDLRPDDEQKEEPEIEKLVYDIDNKKWEDDTINLGGLRPNGRLINPDHEVVTFLGIFDPGSAVTSEIWDKSIERDGEIDATPAGTGGSLEFLDLLVAIEGDNGQEYVIYQSDGFDEDVFEKESRYLGEKIEDYDNFGDDIDDLEDDYNCDDGDKRNTRVCLADYDDTLRDFSRGDKIEFENLDKAKNIFVFYQMKNGTQLSEEYCTGLIDRLGTCGEQYENEINFEAEDSDGDDYDGDDDVRVVVICPFILSREGGDSFFHSAFETGIDVSACYEVDTCEGPCITPDPEKPDTPSTGPGEVSLDEVLTAPTHDICKISNTEDVEIEEYRNVFKNFSSSVCEMQTQVAEEWKEKVINAAISANIEKLDRFGEAETSVKDVKDSITFINGVFITENTLTVNSDYLISGQAQTYIVKGADLIINADIKYDDSNVDITDPNSFPSAAFIVIDGNIKIGPDVKQLDGVYMAVDMEGIGKGQITADEITYNILTVRGSLIGDIFSLYQNRKGIGNPLKDESSITVKFDERIILNTPPGLTELIDVNQLKVAN